MGFNATEFLGGLSGDPAVRVPDSKNGPLDTLQADIGGRRIACAGRGAIGRGSDTPDSTEAIVEDGDDSDVADLALDDADRAVLEYLAGLRYGGPIVADPVFTEPTTVNGTTVPRGWTIARWREELERMASRCESVRPDRAAELRADAKRLDDTSKPEMETHYDQERNSNTAERANRNMAPGLDRVAAVAR